MGFDCGFGSWRQQGVVGVRVRGAGLDCVRCNLRRVQVGSGMGVVARLRIHGVEFMSGSKCGYGLGSGPRLGFGQACLKCTIEQLVSVSLTHTVMGGT